MKLSEWTDAQCSRWIAERLEPFAGLPDAECEDGTVGDMSPLNCYWIDLVELQTTGFFAPAWLPCDFVGNPAMTVMLLTGFWSCAAVSSRAGDAIRVSKNHPDDDLWRVDVMTPGGMKQLASNPKLGRAVVEAFMLANGWTEKEL